MECDQRTFVGLVLIFASASVISCGLAQQNKVVDAIKLDEINKISSHVPAGWQSRSPDAASKSYSNCSGLKVI